MQLFYDAAALLFKFELLYSAAACNNSLVAPRYSRELPPHRLVGLLVPVGDVHPQLVALVPRHLVQGLQTWAIKTLNYLCNLFPYYCRYFQVPLVKISSSYSITFAGGAKQFIPLLLSVLSNTHCKNRTTYSVGGGQRKDLNRLPAIRHMHGLCRIFNQEQPIDGSFNTSQYGFKVARKSQFCQF